MDTISCELGRICILLMLTMTGCKFFCMPLLIFWLIFLSWLTVDCWNLQLLLLNCIFLFHNYHVYFIYLGAFMWCIFICIVGFKKMYNFFHWEIPFFSHVKFFSIMCSLILLALMSPLQLYSAVWMVYHCHFLNFEHLYVFEDNCLLHIAYSWTLGLLRSLISFACLGERLSPFVWNVTCKVV